MPVCLVKARAWVHHTQAYNAAVLHTCFAPEPRACKYLGLSARSRAWGAGTHEEPQRRCLLRRSGAGVYLMQGCKMPCCPGLHYTPSSLGTPVLSCMWHRVAWTTTTCCSRLAASHCQLAALVVPSLTLPDSLKKQSHPAHDGDRHCSIKALRPLGMLGKLKVYKRDEPERALTWCCACCLLGAGIWRWSRYKGPCARCQLRACGRRNLAICGLWLGLVRVVPSVRLAHQLLHALHCSPPNTQRSHNLLWTLETTGCLVGTLDGLSIHFDASYENSWSAVAADHRPWYTWRFKAYAV